MVSRSPHSLVIDQQLIRLEAVEPELLTGELVVLGVRHVVQLLRVELGQCGEQWPMASAGVDRFEAEFSLDPRNRQTVRLPGQDGEWLLFITPVAG